MRTITRLLVVLVATLSACLPLAGAAEAPAAPPAAGFYVLTGDWKGEGSVTENGQQAHFELQLQCHKASAGWAVLCTMSGRDRAGNQVLAETDLFGVDPATGKGHWYAVTNSGETHDHLVYWSDPKTLRAHLAWQLEDKRMEESIVLDLAVADTLEFRSVTSENGHQRSLFRATLQRGS
jgi:hypothetical protein